MLYKISILLIDCKRKNETKYGTVKEKNNSTFTIY